MSILKILEIVFLDRLKIGNLLLLKIIKLIKVNLYNNKIKIIQEKVQEHFSDSKEVSK
jgi:hypothetical protein